MTWAEFSLCYPGWAWLVTYVACYAVAAGAIAVSAYSIYRIWITVWECERPEAPWEDGK